MKCRPRSSSASGFSRSRGRRDGGDRTAVPASMAPMIERMFRYIWFLATEKRDAMAREGRQDELDALVAEARSFQKSLRRGAED